MGSKTFKDLESMYMQFKKDAIESVNNIVPNKMKKIMQSAIEIEVYGQYDATLYTQKRYDNGGFHDMRNMKHDLIITDKSVKIMLRNITKGDDRGIYGNSQPYEYIDTIIVTGYGYSWRNSTISRLGIERDFYTKTEELLKESNILNEIKNDMNKRGW